MSWPINISTGLPGGPIQYLGFGGAGSLVITALGVGASAADVDAGTALIVAGVVGFFLVFLIGLVILLWGRHFVTEQDFQRVDAENARLGGLPRSHARPGRIGRAVGS